MTRTIAGVEAYAIAHPYRSDGSSRAGWCEEFVHDAGGFTERFTFATAAGDASGPLDLDPTTAQPGEIHYFGGGPGHDCFQTSHGLLMASMSVSSISPGLGYLPTVQDYLNAWPSHPYRGHTWRHGTETLQPSTSPASSILIPILPFRIPLKGPDMPNAAIVRNYAAEARGEVATALIYPDGTAVLLHATEDVDSAVIAHIQVYGLPPTTNEPKKVTPRDKYGSQVDDAQWEWFWKLYPGTKIGF